MLRSFSSTFNVNKNQIKELMLKNYRPRKHSAEIFITSITYCSAQTSFNEHAMSNE